jgi:hypothetical protein
LELLPIEEDTETIKEIGKGLAERTLTDEELVWALRFLIGDTNIGFPFPFERLYTPYCTARDGICYKVLESPIVYKALYQALFFTVLKSDRMRDCELGKPPAYAPGGEEFLDRFLYNHIPQIRDAKSPE